MQLTRKPKQMGLKSTRSALARTTRKFNLAVASTQPYLPSVGNLATVVIGGAITGVVQSGKTPIPAEIGNISTPLILGGVLAGYAIYAGGQKNGNPMVAKTAMNIGGAMLAVYTSDLVQDAMEQQQSSTGA